MLPANLQSLEDVERFKKDIKILLFKDTQKYIDISYYSDTQWNLSKADTLGALSTLDRCPL